MCLKDYKTKIDVLDTCLRMIDLVFSSSNYPNGKSVTIRAFDDFESTVINLCEEYLKTEGIDNPESLTVEQLIKGLCRCESQLKDFEPVLITMTGIRSAEKGLFKYLSYYSLVERFLKDNFVTLEDFVSKLNV